MSYGTVQAEKMTTESGYSLGAGNASTFKNRLINPEMDIDQRNNGASVTGNSGVYPVDRWGFNVSQTGKFTGQRNAGAVTPPAGFTNYLGVTSSSAYSVLSTDFFGIGQSIEGFNTADLGFGSANAKSVTVSFWVRSSLTGTFSFALINGGYSRGYTTTYTINSANTWEYKTVTIPGDTTGTWATNTDAGIRLFFNLGSGSTQNATPNTWGAWVGWSVVGAQSIVSTNGATWQITGTQLEVGTVATSFDFRSYGTELQLCKRYCNVWRSSGSYEWLVMGFNYNTGAVGSYVYPVEMRSTPTVTFSTQTGFISDFASGNAASTAMSSSYGNQFAIRITLTGSTGNTLPCAIASDVTPGRSVTFSAEL